MNSSHIQFQLFRFMKVFWRTLMNKIEAINSVSVSQKKTLKNWSVVLYKLFSLKIQLKKIKNTSLLHNVRYDKIHVLKWRNLRSHWMRQSLKNEIENSAIFIHRSRVHFLKVLWNVFKTIRSCCIHTCKCWTQKYLVGFY